MEACLRNFCGGWIFELQWGPSMVIFNHRFAAKDKGEKVRGGAITRESSMEEEASPPRECIG